MLKQMFSSIKPDMYDRLNRVATLSLDQLWRHLAAKEILRDNPEKILDLCCGTGDLTVAIAKKIVLRNIAVPGTKMVVGADYCEPFLTYAEEKTQKSRGLINQTPTFLQFVEADAANLPFDDNTFDAVGISFAFRNLTYQNPNSGKHLSEILRVLKPSGKFVFVETSQPRNLIIRKLFHLYMRIIPVIAGTLLGQSRSAYSYFAGSTINFFTKEVAVELLENAGFSVEKFKPFMFGAVALVIAKKI